MAMPSVRIAGAKSGQTNLIQLPGTPGSQITQYAVVSIPQPRLVTTQATTTNAATISGQVTVSGVRTATGISAQSKPVSSTSKPEIVKIGGKMITHPTLIQGQTPNSATPKIVQSAHLQPITAQQLVNAKVLGVQGFQGLSQVSQLNQRVKAGTSIRMVNASNLNIANIDGKPIIIAKTPTMIQSPNQIQKTIWTQQGNNVNAVGKTNIIGTLPASQLQSSQVMFGNQIVKLQPQQSSASVQSNATGQTMSVININANSSNSTGTTQTVSGISTGTSRTVVLGSSGQTIKVHAPNVITTTAKPAVKNVIKGTNLTSSPGQRVVLAVQGGTQFILPQNFQGGTINLKGLKMIPIQTSQTAQIQTNINSQMTSTSQAINPPNSATGES